VDYFKQKFLQSERNRTELAIVFEQHCLALTKDPFCLRKGHPSTAIKPGDHSARFFLVCIA